MDQHNFQSSQAQSQPLQTMNMVQDTPTPATWLELIENGDGYLNPEQRQAFEHAISLVVERINATLGKASLPAEQSEQFDFSRYLESMEERFLSEVREEDEVQQDVALAAARVIEHIGQIILNSRM
ncbi:hypothetical protein [Vibrio mangrovi]|uniref:Uncharacterized protein n=1 Tax=Vibrio mangrovi TaxID=474394 RepID=A0A1Y6J2F1_9VIBR|nr:hypothetical protein [Vibrio mangrovi]MDW6001959.1 hypothetical protein [Vibrio mangrovi]SMS02493.1 hypothetical protein VIM7927_03826 [Vibrio mangrovi]